MTSPEPLADRLMGLAALWVRWAWQVEDKVVAEWMKRRGLKYRDMATAIHNKRWL